MTRFTSDLFILDAFDVLFRKVYEARGRIFQGDTQWKMGFLLLSQYLRKLIFLEKYKTPMLSYKKVLVLFVFMFKMQLFWRLTGDHERWMRESTEFNGSNFLYVFAVRFGSLSSVTYYALQNMLRLITTIGKIKIKYLIRYIFSLN